MAGVNLQLAGGEGRERASLSPLRRLAQHLESDARRWIAPSPVVEFGSIGARLHRRDVAPGAVTHPPGFRGNNDP